MNKGTYSPLIQLLWHIRAVWLTQNGKFGNRCCLRFYRRRNGHDPVIGRSERSSMACFINSRMVAIGKTYPKTSLPTRRSIGTTSSGGQQAQSRNWWVLYMNKCGNRLKKAQVDNVNHHWLSSCEEHLQCQCRLKGVLFLQSDQWH